MEMQPINPDRPFLGLLSIRDWNIVLAALDELPHKVARPVYDRLVVQLQEQSQMTPVAGDQQNDEGAL